MGLIGGSLAKTYHEAGWTVLGFDLNESVSRFAELEGTLSGILDSKNIKQCDLIHIAVTPGAACQWLREHGKEIVASAANRIDCPEASRASAANDPVGIDPTFCNAPRS